MTCSDFYVCPLKLPSNAGRRISYPELYSLSKQGLPGPCPKNFASFSHTSTFWCSDPAMNVLVSRKGSEVGFTSIWRVPPLPPGHVFVGPMPATGCPPMWPTWWLLPCVYGRITMQHIIFCYKTTDKRGGKLVTHMIWIVFRNIWCIDVMYAFLLLSRIVWWMWWFV